MTVERFLEILSEVLRHSLFRIFLHLVVDGSIDAEAVPVKVIPGAVGLGVLVQPAVECVVCPEKRVYHVVFILSIRRALRLLCIHRTAEHVPEIRAYAGVVVLDLI